VVYLRQASLYSVRFKELEYTINEVWNSFCHHFIRERQSVDRSKRLFSFSDRAGRPAELLPDDLVEMLEVGVADFGGDDFDGEVRVGEEFSGAIGAEAAQPDGGGLPRVFFEDSDELVVGDLTASGQAWNGQWLGHFLHDNLGGRFDDTIMPGVTIRMLKNILNPQKDIPKS